MTVEQVAAGPRRRPVEEGGRDRILRAALEEFAARGYDGTTTAGVARRAGVTQPLVHYHYESKDELWRAAVSSVCAELDAAFSDCRDEVAGLDPVAGLELLIRRWVAFSAANPAFGRILAYEGAVGGERLAWLVSRSGADHLLLQAELIEELVEQGRAKPLPLVHVVSSVGAAAAYLFVIRASMRENYGIDVDDPVTIERHADTVIELFLHGLLVAGDEP